MRLFSRIHLEDRPPCKHMVGLLNGTADGSSKGFRRLYALAHAARCGPCGRFLRSLEIMIQALRASKAEEPDAKVLERLKAQTRAAAGKGP